MINCRMKPTISYSHTFRIHHTFSVIYERFIAFTATIINFYFHICSIMLYIFKFTKSYIHLQKVNIRLFRIRILEYFLLLRYQKVGREQ